MAFWSILGKALTITWFVAAMMILVEYINVQTEGRWRKALAGSRWSQYVVAAILGAIPGCLGAFVVVALYIHRSVTMGAVVACMIATSGDEAFVMLAMFPGRAVLLMSALAVVGILAGMVTESGPHLFFVTLYDRGVLPVSVLVTNSIVQDGHGMLPLLSYSWRDFLKIKAINVLVGLVVGAILIALGR